MRFSTLALGCVVVALCPALAEEPATVVPSATPAAEATVTPAVVTPPGEPAAPPTVTAPTAEPAAPRTVTTPAEPATAQTVTTPAAEPATTQAVTPAAAPAVTPAIEPTAAAPVATPPTTTPAAATPAAQTAAAIPPKPICPGNPHALGTSRTLVVDPSTLPRIGNINYRHTLPLNDHEVVITFDDGPLPPYSDRILETLASECVKVTYFIVGQMARAYPETVRKMYNAGHIIGTHSLSHPFHFGDMGLPRIEHEVGGGIAYVKAALGGDARTVAPFFRIPGLARSNQAEQYLAAQSLAVWSADEVADDWRHINAAEIVKRAMRRIEAHDHRGVLLLHDIHPATALALPTLLKELKANGYKIVQAVPTGTRPQSVPDLPAPLVADAGGGWPRLVKTNTDEQKTVRIAHRKHHKRLVAQATDEAKPVHHAKRVAKSDDDAKPVHHRRHVERKIADAELTATLGKKKRKPQTAEQSNRGSVSR
jgi:peptidoglycan/xylan/chitin deacetylase (PgdA/CDA1 family)